MPLDNPIKADVVRMAREFAETQYKLMQLAERMELVIQANDLANPTTGIVDADFVDIPQGEHLTRAELVDFYTYCVRGYSVGDTSWVREDADGAGDSRALKLARVIRTV